MTEPAPARPTRFRTGGLSQRKPTRFHWTADKAQRAELVSDLDLLSLHRLEFTGQIDPVGRDEIRLHGTLTAAVDQACIVTLAPVTSSINEAVTRRYVADLPTPQGEETEMPEDDGLEPMPEVLDLIEIAAETLMLALPLYPRAPGAQFGEKQVTPADTVPVPEVKDKPFAGLASLADRLKTGPKAGDDGTE